MLFGFYFDAQFPASRSAASKFSTLISRTWYRGNVQRVSWNMCHRNPRFNCEIFRRLALSWRTVFDRAFRTIGSFTCRALKIIRKEFQGKRKFLTSQRVLRHYTWSAITMKFDEPRYKASTTTWPKNSSNNKTKNRRWSIKYGFTRAQHNDRRRCFLAMLHSSTESVYF